jgi:predicted nucleotidyltransferase
MVENFGLDVEIISFLCSLFFRNEKINEVVIFGSRAKGSYTKGSDIDLALKGDSLSLDDVYPIRFAIDDFGTLYSIDLLLYDDVKNTPVGDHIDRVGKVFYKKGK